MGIRNLVRAGMVGAAAITLASGTATSQVVTFNQGTCAPSGCYFGAYYLQWSGLAVEPGGGLLGSNFTMTCQSNCTYGNLITGSTFFLIPGRVYYGAANLFWDLTLGGDSHWSGDDGPGCNKACDNNDPPPPPGFAPTVVTTDVTTTPEPATVALMATGLVSLIPVARRRRRN